MDCIQNPTVLSFVKIIDSYSHISVKSFKLRNKGSFAILGFCNGTLENLAFLACKENVLAFDK